MLIIYERVSLSVMFRLPLFGVLVIKWNIVDSRNCTSKLKFLTSVVGLLQIALVIKKNWRL